jgi:DNA-binding MurR/RpiR family transcriptional regulator
VIIEQLIGNKNLTKTEEQIVKFIQDYPRAVINLSLEQLSKQCFVSQASIIRLCKKLGSKGFAEFKIQLASELSSFALDGQQISVDVPIPPNGSCENTAKVFYNLSVKTLEHTFNTLNFSEIEEAAKLLAGADIVYLYGRGESLILAQDFHYKLIRLGIHSSLETLNGFQEARSSHTNSKINEVALVISQYCNSHQFHYVVDELMSNNIPFILLTATQKTWPYDHFAKVTLRIDCLESRHKMGSFNSRTAMLYLLDCIFGQMFSLNYDQNIHNLAQFSQRKVERDYYYKAIQDTNNSD